MSRTVHTPGPWRVSDAHGIVLGADAYRVASTCTPDFDRLISEERANARPIAAAPEMLPLLQECADDLAAVKLTVAERTALQHVADGKVWHHYGATGNAYRSPDGPGKRAYHRLEHLGLIGDLDEGPSRTIFAVRMTHKGFNALRRGEVA